MSNTSVVDADTARRRPNPGYRVAPPVADAYAPWVYALDDALQSSGYRWTVGPDGVLVPTAMHDEHGATTRPNRRLWRRRTQ